MNLIDTLRGLLRRWYILVAGLVLAVAVAFGSWTVVTPGYERTATQLLLPGRGTLPGSSPNPYLFLGGLTYAADVLVRAVGSENLVNEVTERYPGTDVTVTRDPTTAGPVILITVTAKSDADAKEVLAMLVDRTANTLEQIQIEENVAPRNQMTVTSVTVDEQSTIRQRTRLVVTVGAAGGIIVLSILVASLVDGLIRSSTRGRRGGRTSAATAVEDNEAPDPLNEHLAAAAGGADSEEDLVPEIVEAGPTVIESSEEPGHPVVDSPGTAGTNAEEEAALDTVEVDRDDKASVGSERSDSAETVRND